ncbi:glycosyltransferase family 4 protein [Epilithonimonas hispanica]|uniref:Glycosyl transferase family 1 domain-containing protein n=1 Tax=Epilithonimonas hispanica TaxID=358687 RepID=A0A3D9CTU9_9FLAO|nr:glycosyltransferase family 4 protein [Epilithonimonas hispanica]REC69182.1 hypothetical protein DRF58_12605 [Epilithonimonas hispanica]
MNIIFFIGSLANSGGMERMLTFQANYFADKFGHNVTILTYEQGDHQDFFQVSNKVKRVKLSFEKPNHSSSIITLYLQRNYKEKLQIEIEKILFQSNFDISLSFGIEGSFLYKIKDNSKKIVEFHFSKDFYKQDSGNFLQKIWRGYRFKQSIQRTKEYDKMVILTETDQLFWEKYLSNVVVINNPNVMQADINAPLESKVAISLGRLTKQKGYDRLIEIWEKVVQKFPDWKLHIYGDGKEKNALLQLIDEKNLSKFIQIYPTVSDVSEIYQSASFYLMTSRFEGFPLVLIEAMSCGLPAIAYSIIGPNELVQNNVNGFLIEDGDTDAFVNHIEILCSDFEKRKELGENAKKLVEKFSPLQIMNQWNDLFNQVVKK